MAAALRTSTKLFNSFKTFQLRKFAQAASQTKTQGSGQPAACDSAASKKGIVLGYFESESDNRVLTPSAMKFNEKTNGKLLEMLNCEEPIGPGKALSFTNIDTEYQAVALVNLGESKRGYNELEAIDEEREAVRIAAGAGIQEILNHRPSQVVLETFGLPESAAEGGVLALWRYQENRKLTTRMKIPTLEPYENDNDEAWKIGTVKAQAQNFARRLCEAPANQMTPTTFAQQAVDILCPCGIKVEIHNRDWCEANEMHPFLLIARGSCEPPIFLEVSYCGGPADQDPIVLVGKGVTFDAGGLCTKPLEEMNTYGRAHMCGAASVLAVIRACAALSLPININGLMPMCENVPSGMSARVGDIVTFRNGKSIRISDTDNEGRICVAEALLYAQQHFKPRMLLDVGSFSNSVLYALGAGASAVFSNNDKIWKEVRKAGILTGDRVWRLPLWEYYRKNVTDFHSHDVDNVGKGEGDVCLTAAFLNEFVQCVDWLHMDISGTMYSDDKVHPCYTQHLMTGRPTRTIIQLLYQMACQQDSKTE